jgi:collagenase-like PrtC family protease
MDKNRYRLSVGPIQFHWPRQQMLDFYERIEASEVDIVYLGETVCSKRRELRHQDWLDVAERLLASSKEVVFSTLALVEARSEIAYIRKLCEQDRFLVEANDMTAVQLLAGNTSFVGGSTLNIQNDIALGRLIELGLIRWVAPVEMPARALQDIRGRIPDTVESELLGWGRMPLAYSARCYTARAHGVTKDDCANCCLEYADGLMLETRDSDEFLVLNGIQTMSAKTLCLAEEYDDAAAAPDILRISPQSAGTEDVIALFNSIRQESITTKDAIANLQSIVPEGLCNGYWHDSAGMNSCGRIADQ